MERERGALNLISIPIAPATEVVQRRYYDLPRTIDPMRLLWQEAVVDAFELQNMGEWDDEEPPRDERERRLVAWRESEKHTIAEIAAVLQEAEVPVLSVHANRDVGACLCTGNGSATVDDDVAWVQDDAPFSFYEALDTIKNKWAYTGLLRMEPAGVLDGDWESLLAAVGTLRAL